MIRSRFTTLATLAVLAFAATACGGDDDDNGTGPSETGNLSATEVADALDALSAVGLFNFGVGFQPAGLPVGLSAQSQSVDETQACPNGGNVRVAGNVSVNQSTGAVTADVRQTHNACQAPSSTGRVWTFNGNPNLRTQITAAINQASGAFTINGTISGGIRYSSNGASGSCTSNITISGSQNGGTVRGTFCGVSVDETWSIDDEF
jgi:hypothetical protein